MITYRSVGDGPVSSSKWSVPWKVRTTWGQTELCNTMTPVINMLEGLILMAVRSLGGFHNSTLLTPTSRSLKTEGLNRRAFEPKIKRRFQHQSRKFLADGFIGWCVNEMPVPTPVRTTFNCLYSFAQIKPQSDFI